MLRIMRDRLQARNSQSWRVSELSIDVLLEQRDIERDEIPSGSLPMVELAIERLWSESRWELMEWAEGTCDIRVISCLIGNRILQSCVITYLIQSYTYCIWIDKLTHLQNSPKSQLLQMITWICFLLSVSHPQLYHHNRLECFVNLCHHSMTK